MSETDAVVIYDYKPEDSESLEIHSGEHLVITNLNIGSGWYEATNANGDKGYIPEKYVKLINTPKETQSRSSSLIERGSSKSLSLEDDSDWTESDSEELPMNVDDDSYTDKLSNGNSKVVSVDSETITTGNIKLPRWFVRSGGEDLILGKYGTADAVQATVELTRENGCVTYRWKKSPKQTCVIQSRDKVTNLGGMQAYIRYALKTSCSNNVIYRRYNQFDWLYKALTEKFPCIVIPPIPPKQAFGRFDDPFLDVRQQQLQHWLTYITKHPVLSNFSAVKHFLSENDKLRWLIGQRRAKEDPYKGARFFLTIDCPCDPIDWDQYCTRIDSVSIFRENFQRNVRKLQESFEVFNRQRIDSIFNQFYKIGSAITSVSKAMSLNPDKNKTDINLLHGIQKSGMTFEKVGKLFKEQSIVDHDHLDINLEEINNCTKRMGSLVDLAKCASSFVPNGYQKSPDSLPVDIIESKVQVITKSIDAELNWNQKEREKQIRSTMKVYLTNQLKMYNEITKTITDALASF